MAQKNLENSQAVTKEKYDETVRPFEFEVGNLVMVHFPNLGTSKKFAKKWLGRPLYGIG